MNRQLKNQLDTILLGSLAISIVPVQIEDANALASLITGDSAYLQNYLPAVAVLASPVAARAHLERAMTLSAEGGILEWHLFCGDILCGSVRLKEIDRIDRKAKIGYFLASQFQGKGIVTTAVRRVVAHAFEVLELNRIELHCAAGNSPSIAVAERLGFSLEGILREDELLNGRFVDQRVYGLLRREWRR